MDNFHGKEGLGTETGFSGAGLIDLRDAGMVETAKSLRLKLESAQQFAIGPGGLNNFQRDPAPGLVLLGLIDRTHPALAQQANNAVPPNPLGKPLRRLRLRRTSRNRSCFAVVGRSPVQPGRTRTSPHTRLIFFVQKRLPIPSS